MIITQEAPPTAPQPLPVGIPGLAAKLAAIAEKRQAEPDAATWAAYAQTAADLQLRTRLGHTITGTIAQTLEVHCHQLQDICEIIVSRRAWVTPETASWWSRQARILEITASGFAEAAETLGPETLPPVA